MKALYSNKEGKVQYIADCPEEPKPFPQTKGSNLSTDMDRYYQSILDYPKALQAAKDSAVDCVDQEAWKFQLWCISSTLLNTTPEEWVSKNLDTIQPFPENYDVEVKESWGPFHEWTSPEKVAVITKKAEPKQEESQEELWKLVFHQAGSRMDFMQFLMKHFTITRR